MRYPAGAGRAGATAADLPDTPQGGARRMRWLHMSSIILEISGDIMYRDHGIS